MSEQLQILIYEDTEKAVDVRLDEGHETVWLTQRQMAELFDKDVRTINEHVLNVYEEGEWERASYLEIPDSSSGGLASGCTSHRALQSGCDHFGWLSRQITSRNALSPMATRVLRDHLTQSWALHQQRFEANAWEAAMHWCASHVWVVAKEQGSRGHFFVESNQ